MGKRGIAYAEQYHKGENNETAYRGGEEKGSERNTEARVGVRQTR